MIHSMFFTVSGRQHKGENLKGTKQETVTSAVMTHPNDHSHEAVDALCGLVLRRVAELAKGSGTPIVDQHNRSLYLLQLG